jgi:hypothetical protein
MAARCAADLKDPGKAMVGFGVFYRLLVAQFPLPFGPRGVSAVGLVSRVAPVHTAMRTAPASSPPPRHLDDSRALLGCPPRLTR